METTQQTQVKIWLNGKESADLIGITYNTLKKLRDTGKIRAHRISRQVILYDRDELREDINSLGL